MIHNNDDNYSHNNNDNNDNDNTTNNDNQLCARLLIRVGATLRVAADRGEFPGITEELYVFQWC